VLSKKHFEETNKLNSGVLFEIVEYIWHLNSISNCSDEHYFLVYLNRVVHEMFGLSLTMSKKDCIAHFVLTAMVIQLEALEQCMPPARHVLPVSPWIRICDPDHHQNLIICLLAHYQPSLQNFMQICSEAFAQSC